jgi:glucokinase
MIRASNLKVSYNSRASTTQEQFVSTQRLPSTGPATARTALPISIGVLAWGPEDPIVISIEGGHATLAGASDREDEIIKQLRSRFGHVTAERVVSG